MLYKIKNFFNNKYGIDKLSIALIVLSFIINFIFSIVAPKWYIRLVVFVPLILALLRTISTDFAKRQAENEEFLRLYYPIKAQFIKLFAFISKKRKQFKDKEHKYYSCPNCKRTLRVPSHKGKINITCPHCSTVFSKNTGKFQ